ncbi:MAG: helix-turn-helix domain-containing protein [Vibrio sp.]|uniref:helix-turn-helix domain-containing protein n=1 Tax=Vibrio sp. TaxID=678 RepID=UPI003A882BC2
MKVNIVTKIIDEYFDGSVPRASEYFGVSYQSVLKWIKQGEFPAKYGRMQQAHVLTGIDHKLLTPSAFTLPDNHKLQHVAA